MLQISNLTHRHPSNSTAQLSVLSLSLDADEHALVLGTSDCRNSLLETPDENLPDIFADLILRCRHPSGAAKEYPAHVAATIEQHKEIAAVHQASVRCLALGKDEEICHADLSRACKGLAIGKLYGMKHKH